jgi:hypothetical protein
MASLQSKNITKIKECARFLARAPLIKIKCMGAGNPYKGTRGG